MENEKIEKTVTSEEKIAEQMKQKIIYLKNKNTEEIKKVPFGFSWSTLFLGYWVPLSRKDWKYAGVIFVLVVIELLLINGHVINNLAYVEDKFYVIGKLAGKLLVPMFTIGSIVFAFFYNKLYIKELLKKGFVPKDKADDVILQKLKIELPQ